VADAAGYPLASPDACSIARTLDVLGDTWSVLVMREMFLGTHRFDQFQAHLGIARNILAARLRRLGDHGILAKRVYQEHPPRFEYHLTRKGVDLYPVIIGLMQWGDHYLAGADGGPVVLEHTRCGQLTELVQACRACGEAIDPREMRALPRGTV
jgi:DNA-binding HxlR family transcriptional regulator